MFTRKKRAIILLALPLLALKVQAQDAQSIVARAEEKFLGQSSRGEVIVQVVRPNWSREMSLTTWSKGDEFSLILITAPAKEEGTVFLKRQNEIWNWIPSIERTVKLPPSMMMQSWMGTDFTNDDLVNESSLEEDYIHELKGDSTILGRSCYKIQLLPKEDAPVVWGKLLMWISKDELLQLRTEFYDEDGELVNIMEGSEVKSLGGRQLPARLEMIPVDEEGNKTVLIYESLEFNIDIQESFFTTRNMKAISRNN